MDYFSDGFVAISPSRSRCGMIAQASLQPKNLLSMYLF